MVAVLLRLQNSLDRSSYHNVSSNETLSHQVMALSKPIFHILLLLQPYMSDLWNLNLYVDLLEVKAKAIHS